MTAGDLPQLAQRLASSLRGTFEQPDSVLVVVTGAGISAASGIATFRGSEPDAIWRQHDVELATRATFERDPVAQWTWYLDRFAALDGARPNPAHDAVYELEQRCIAAGTSFHLVTQNIDTLHEEAGSRSLLKVHGTADRLRCSSPPCPNAAPCGSIDRSRIDLAPLRAQPSYGTLPRCPECGSVLRAHVLFFDEYYNEHADYRFDEVTAAAETATTMIFVGTSFAVGVTDLFVRTGVQNGIELLSIDPSGAAERLPVINYPACAEELLPLAIQLLDA